MSQLVKIILIWSVIEIVATSVADAFSPAAIYPVSWGVYALAGRHAAQRGETWHGIVAGGSVPLIENLIWLTQGAPGHADTSDLPWFIAALTYITLVIGTVAIGVVCGSIGAVFGRWARNRVERRKSLGAEVNG